jgi:hypothetical protein
MDIFPTHVFAQNYSSCSSFASTSLERAHILAAILWIALLLHHSNSSQQQTDLLPCYTFLFYFVSFRSQTFFDDFIFRIRKLNFTLDLSNFPPKTFISFILNFHDRDFLYLHSFEMSISVIKCFSLFFSFSGLGIDCILDMAVRMRH